MAKQDSKDAKDAKVPDVTIDFDGLGDRIVSIPVPGGDLSKRRLPRT